MPWTPRCSTARTCCRGTRCTTWWSPTRPWTTSSPSCRSTPSRCWWCTPLGLRSSWGSFWRCGRAPSRPWLASCSVGAGRCRRCCGRCSPRCRKCRCQSCTPRTTSATPSRSSPRGRGSCARRAWSRWRRRSGCSSETWTLRRCAGSSASRHRPSSRRSSSSTASSSRRAMTASASCSLRATTRASCEPPPSSRAGACATCFCSASPRRWQRWPRGTTSI
mmetsp:Transcript_6674/g.27228  ORF Transcript_6674/g.27228 Transcript_6674/m.27228 type:complete len:220 (+) Transcript_6674:701-1360(+)